MMKRILFTILFFYFLALLQASFFVHFSKFFPNLIFLAVISINLLESQKENFGVFAALTGGFFWDIYSGYFIGLFTLISLFTSLFIKLFIKNYFQFSFNRI